MKRSLPAAVPKPNPLGIPTKKRAEVTRLYLLGNTYPDIIAAVGGGVTKQQIKHFAEHQRLKRPAGYVKNPRHVWFDARDQAIADGLKLNLPWADILAHVNAIPGPIVTRAATVARSRYLGMARSMPFVAAPRPKAPRKPRVKKPKITPWTPERVAELYAGHAAHRSAQTVVATVQAMEGLPLTQKAVRSKAQNLRLLWQRRAIVRVKIIKVPVVKITKVSRIIQLAAIPIPEPVYVAPLVEPLPGPDGIVAAPLEYVMNFCAVHGISDQWLDMDRVNKVRKWLKMPPMVVDCTTGAAV
jgi:hypothetical protein